MPPGQRRRPLLCWQWSRLKMNTRTGYTTERYPKANRFRYKAITEIIIYSPKRGLSVCIPFWYSFSAWTIANRVRASFFVRGAMKFGLIATFHYGKFHTPELFQSFLINILLWNGLKWIYILWRGIKKFRLFFRMRYYSVKKILT